MRILEEPYIGACCLLLTIDGAVPFFGPVGGGEYFLPEAVENAEYQIIGLVGVEGIQIVIEPITVRCKCGRDVYIATAHYLNGLNSRVEATDIVFNDQPYGVVLVGEGCRVVMCRRRLELTADSIPEIPVLVLNIANALVNVDRAVIGAYRTATFKIGPECVI